MNVKLNPDLMKKLLLLLALAVATACNTEDERPLTTSATYAGTLTVTSNASPEAAPFSMDDARYEMSEGEGGTFNLTMHEIRFAQTMPMSLTIVLPELRTLSESKKGVYEIVSTVTPIVPYIGGKPYAAFEILDFEASFTRSGSELQVAFTCRNPRISVGSESLDHRAVFSGTIDR